MQIAEPIRKCSHGIYHPADQDVPHACYLCNPNLFQHDETPEKTAALWRIENGLALEGLERLHAYDTIVEFKARGGVMRKHRYGTIAYV